MGLIRELRKAKSEATAAVKSWRADNPRRAGESLAQYRRRCQEALQAQFRQKYAEGDWSSWLKIILEVLKMIIPLLITCVLFAVLIALPTASRATDLQWYTLDDATVVASSPATLCANSQCAVPRRVATGNRAGAALVRGQPIRNAGRVIVASRPIRRVGRAVGAVVRARPLARLVGCRR